MRRFVLFCPGWPWPSSGSRPAPAPWPRAPSSAGVDGGPRGRLGRGRPALGRGRSAASPGFGRGPQQPRRRLRKDGRLGGGPPGIRSGPPASPRESDDQGELRRPSRPALGGRPGEDALRAPARGHPRARHRRRAGLPVRGRFRHPGRSARRLSPSPPGSFDEIIVTDFRDDVPARRISTPGRELHEYLATELGRAFRGTVIPSSDEPPTEALERRRPRTRRRPRRLGPPRRPRSARPWREERCPWTVLSSTDGRGLVEVRRWTLSVDLSVLSAATARRSINKSSAKSAITSTSKNRPNSPSPSSPTASAPAFFRSFSARRRSRRDPPPALSRPSSKRDKTDGFRPSARASPRAAFPPVFRRPPGPPRLRFRALAAGRPSDDPPEARFPLKKSLK